jgi:hypothetical protein
MATFHEKLPPPHSRFSARGPGWPTRPEGERKSRTWLLALGSFRKKPSCLLLLPIAYREWVRSRDFGCRPSLGSFRQILRTAPSLSIRAWVRSREFGCWPSSASHIQLATEFVLARRFAPLRALDRLRVAREFGRSTRQMPHDGAAGVSRGHRPKAERWLNFLGTRARIQRQRCLRFMVA